MKKQIQLNNILPQLEEFAEDVSKLDAASLAQKHHVTQEMAEEAISLLQGTLFEELNSQNRNNLIQEGKKFIDENLFPGW